MTDAVAAPLLARVVAVLRRAPAGVVTDFDGTLSAIVPDPSAAGPVPGGAEALAALAERIAVVAVVTGREAVEARRLVGVPALLVVGNHGTEWLEPGADAPEAPADAAAVADALDRALAAVPPGDGIELEHKGLSATVHYRRAPDPGAARDRIVAALGDALDPSVALRHGRMSVELRPVGRGDKGSGLREVVARHGLRGLVVLGDDVTDVDMMRAAAELREAGTLDAALVAVTDAGETPPEVLAAADATVDGPEGAAALLAAAAEALAG